MSDLETVIGLEIHCQLKTATKLFCSCPARSGDAPNSHICEVCSGQPGALPRLNGRAVWLAAKAGLALGCQVQELSIFSRKNYFYPDLPGGFQTSQLDPPICLGGGLSIGPEDEPILIRLNRIHLEDDAGKCLHDEARGQTLVDLNRAGTPLIEIVTEPDLRSSDQVAEFLKKLHALLVHLEVTEGRLEEGEFRCDVNISLRPRGVTWFGTRCEIKNLNSFRHAAQAVEYEAIRQENLLAQGRAVSQETRLFDPVRQETRSLRSKEEAHDYRYFPQPDLPPVLVSREMLDKIKAEMPEPPGAIKTRLKALGLTDEQVELLLDRRAVKYFDAARLILDEPKRLATLMVELLLPACQRAELSPADCRLTPMGLATLAKLVADNTLSRRAAYEIFPDLFEKGGDPANLAKDRGLLQVSDSETIKALAAEVMAAHPEEAEKYRQGQDKIMSFFVGQIMKKSRGAANPKLAGEALAELLKK